MIDGLQVRELPSQAGAAGLAIELWQGEPARGHLASSCYNLFPGIIEAWRVNERSFERVICLRGMIKLVTCDRRPDSPTRDEVSELFLGEYRYREITIPPGVLRGWKAIGDMPALILSILEGEAGESRAIGAEEAGVPYDWKIVMK